jgi:hypothetical protein
LLSLGNRLGKRDVVKLINAPLTMMNLDRQVDVALERSGSVVERWKKNHGGLNRFLLAISLSPMKAFFGTAPMRAKDKSERFTSWTSIGVSTLATVLYFLVVVGLQTSGSSMTMNLEHLESLYKRQKNWATQAAGNLVDIPRRAVLLNEIYLDSAKNHTFSQIAAHGALWAYRFFEVGGRLGKIISWRYIYNSRERTYRLGLLNQFAEGFREVNRKVFIDTFTNYYFTREHGREPGADQLIQPSLLEALNRVHRAREVGEGLSAAEKKNVFDQSFFWEQELTVAPGVQKTVSQFECPIMVALCTKPFVRFAYFPRMSYIFFRNFADKAERIDKGMRAYDMAARSGWGRVFTSQRDYRLLPGAFFASPRDYAAQLIQGCRPA